MLFLVYATYNPWGSSYFHWVVDHSGQIPLKIFSGVVLIIAYAILLQLTWRSLGPLGVALTIAFCTAVVWTLVDYGLLDLNQESAVANTMNVCLAYLFNTGVSWSHSRTRLSGLIDAKDVNQY